MIYKPIAKEAKTIAKHIAKTKAKAIAKPIAKTIVKDIFNPIAKAKAKTTAIGFIAKTKVKAII